MTNQERLLSDLRNLKYDRVAVQLMHDEIARLTDDIDGHKDSHHSDINSDINSCSHHELSALREERDHLMESLKLTVNHIARLERLLGFLSPEEQLIIDRMLINPYKNCTLDLMESLHLEKSQIYNLRAGAMKKLLRLRYGACASACAEPYKVDATSALRVYKRATERSDVRRRSHAPQALSES